MAISWDSFDKIWASTSPLTPYSFSDPNYAQGWNFVGSTPPARQMWDSIQKQNDEKFKYLRDNFGTPNIVTQASQMTDTDKVYVYLGSEAGWNNGHWYYYDEGTSSWADGGVYNSVAFVTDTTLSIAGQPADAKATGDALALKSDLAGCTFTGNVSINADFSVTGDATIGTDLSVTGSSTFTGNVSANGDVTVTGDVSSANMTTSADATIGGDLSVTGTTSLTGNVTAGDVTANDVSVANINASNNGTIGGSLSVTGTSSLVGDVTASGDVNATGDVTADNISATTNGTIGGALSVAGASTLTGNVSAGADVVAVGDVSSANIIASNNANIGGNATVTGSVASASLTTTADGTIGGNLSVSGTTTLTGDVSASADLIVAGDSSLTNLSVSGTTALAGTSTAPTPSADDNSTKIATTEYVQTELKPIETKATIDDKRISNIEKLLQGNLYDYQTDSTSAYTKSVPQGAMPYASLEQIGGKTLVWNQLCGNINATQFITKVTDGHYVVNGNPAYYTPSFVDENGNIVKSVSGHKYFIRFNCDEVNITLFCGTTVLANSSVSLTNSSITTINSVGNLMFRAGNSSGTTTYTNCNVYATIVDLTLCYGAGNEPTTVTEFTTQFPAPYYAHNSGTLLSAGVTEVKSVGINVWDEQWENGEINQYGNIVTNNNLIVSKNYIDVSLSNTYYFQFPNTSGAKLYIAGYDINKNFVKFIPSASGIASHNDVIIPDNVFYVKINMGSAYGNTYHNDICINVSNASYNGNYYPYNGHIYPIPAEIQALEGYGWSAGTVYNYIDFERKVFVKNVGSVDLGALTWTYQSTANAFYTTDITNIIVPATKNLICPNYVFGSIVASVSQIASFPDKQVYRQPGNKNVFIKDSAYTDATTFKTAMNGVYLYYELATPQEIDISEYLTDDNLIEVEAGGSLTFPNSNGDDYRINVPSSETYMVDLQSAI